MTAICSHPHLIALKRGAALAVSGPAGELTAAVIATAAIAALPSDRVGAQ